MVPSFIKGIKVFIRGYQVIRVYQVKVCQVRCIRKGGFINKGFHQVRFYQVGGYHVKGDQVKRGVPSKRRLQKAKGVPK